LMMKDRIGSVSVHRVIPGRRAAPGPESIPPASRYRTVDVSFSCSVFMDSGLLAPLGPGMTAKANAPLPVCHAGRGLPCPFPLPPKREWSAGRRQGFARPLRHPLRSGHLAHRGSASGVTAGSSVVRMGLRRPSRGARVPQWRVCETHRPDAAPPGAPPAIQFSPYLPRRIGPDLRLVLRPCPLHPPRHDGGGRAEKGTATYIPIIGTCQTDIRLRSPAWNKPIQTPLSCTCPTQQK